MATPVSHAHWAAELLRAANLPVSPNNLKTVMAWQQAEGGTASNNPFNTTQGGPGATDYNSVHVRNYPSWQAGLTATSQTLHNGYYQDILKDFMHNADPRVTGEAIDNSPWGTKHVLDVLGSPDFHNTMTAQAAANPTTPVRQQMAQTVVSAPKPPAPVGPSPQLQQSNFTRDALLKYVMGNIASSAHGGAESDISPTLNKILSFTPKTTMPLQALVSSPKPLVDPNGSLTHPKSIIAPKQPSNLGSQAVSFAAKQIGQPYVWGGESRKEGGFDCSGLIDWAYRAAGVNFPTRETTYSLLHVGKSVKNQSLIPGDIVVVNHGEHVVMYAGDGKVIAAPHTGEVVQYQPFSKFKDSIVDVRRL